MVGPWWNPSTWNLTCFSSGNFLFLFCSPNYVNIGPLELFYIVSLIFISLPFLTLLSKKITSYRFFHFCSTLLVFKSVFLLYTFFFLGYPTFISGLHCLLLPKDTNSRILLLMLSFLSRVSDCSKFLSHLFQSRSLMLEASHNYQEILKFLPLFKNGELKTHWTLWK